MVISLCSITLFRGKKNRKIKKIKKTLTELTNYKNKKKLFWFGFDFKSFKPIEADQVKPVQQR